MFSNARFNATKLNIAASVNQVLLQAVFSETLAARMGISVEYRVDALTFSAMLEQYGIGSAAIPAGYDLAAAIGMTSSALLAAPIESLFAEKMETNIHAQADHFHCGEMADQLAVTSVSGGNIWFAVSAENVLAVQAQIGAEMALSHIFSEILTLLPDASAQTEQVLLLRVELPAGSELRIDSERYTVTLDGENILHLQEGDWIALDRGLVSVSVDSGTRSRLEGQMVVRERYL